MEQIQETAATLADSIGAMVGPLANIWGGDESKRTEKNRSPLGLFQGQNTKIKSKSKPIWRQFGPGGAVGIGCGAGIGVAVTGGAGLGSEPWNALKLVFGIGLGCGVGLGYGFGTGFGVRWDKKPKKSLASKRVVIEI